MLDKILDFLFPPRCAFCRDILTDKAPVCQQCTGALPFTDENVCQLCGRPVGELSHSICADCRKKKIYFEHSFVPLIYEGRAKDAAVALKASHPYFAKAFAYLLADKILSSPFYTAFDAVTFVPQSKASRKMRGYNQAELIAAELSSLLKAPCISTLYRTDGGKAQHMLSAPERYENVKKCFFKTESTGQGTVLLVDDIYTTGATANYCSKLLLQMGFEKVYLAISLIRTD